MDTSPARPRAGTTEPVRTQYDGAYGDELDQPAAELVGAQMYGALQAGGARGLGGSHTAA